VRKSILYLIVSGFVLAVAVSFANTGIIASAQNTNSSTTNTPAKAKTKRRAKPKAPSAGRCDPTQQEQTDLSGTYTGKLKHGDQPVMDATLTITGNNFTMTSGSDSHSGRITAVTTCGYTAVTVMMGDPTPPDPTKPPPPPLPAMSLRAKKMGDKITLTSVPGEKQMVTFTSAGAGMRPRTHKPRRPKKPATTTGASTTTPATTEKKPAKPKATPKPKAKPANKNANRT
jgi:hypothetical protein